MGRPKRLANGELRPARKRYMQRRSRQRQRERDAAPERQAWLALFDPSERARFFMVADLDQARWFRQAAVQLHISEERASELLDRIATRKDWLKLRKRDGQVVGIAPAKKRRGAYARRGVG